MNRITYALALIVALIVTLPVATRAQQGGAPALEKIGPATVVVDDPDFTLRVRGENFDTQSVVLLDGQPLETLFVSKKRLRARVPGEVMEAAGSHTISVRTGAGATTGTLAFTVVAKEPGLTIERVNPDSFEVVGFGNAQIIFRLAGSGFNDGSKVLIYGQAVETEVFERGILQFLVPTELLDAPGLMPIQVRNSGGALSNLFTVTIVDKPAQIASLDPPSVKAGSAAFKLTLTGAGFSPEARVLFNGVELQPTTVRDQKIEVTVPASLVADVQQAVIYVVQSTGLSNAAVFRVTPTDGDPVLYTVAPDEVQAGAGGQTVEISGANFGENSVVLVNGNEVRTTFVGRAKLTFKLTESQTATPGVTYTVQVRNSGGVVSNILSFTVVEAAVVSTVSGENLDGFVDGALGTARFRRPSRIAVGPDGRLYIADQSNHAIRRLDPSTGIVETLAGDGTAGYVDSGDSTKPDLSVPRFNNPLGVAVADDGTVYVSDYGNLVIRRMRPQGSGYVVDTVAGRNAMITDRENQTRTESNSTRRGIPGYMDGAGTTARFRGPDGMALGSNGLLYVADAQNHYIRAVDTESGSFTVSTIAGLGIGAFADGDRDTARFRLPADVALTPQEDALIVADLGNNRVRRIDLETSTVTTFAGSGAEAVASGPELLAAYRGPIGVTVAPDGTVYVTDNGSNTIRKVTPEGITTTLTGNPNRSKFRDGIGPNARFKDPRGIVYHRQLGVLYVADQGHHRIREIEP